MLKLFKKDKENKEEIQLDFDNIPKHIAIIMDGNGRWANKESFQDQWDTKLVLKLLEESLKKLID